MRWSGRGEMRTWLQEGVVEALARMKKCVTMSRSFSKWDKVKANIALDAVYAHQVFEFRDIFQLFSIWNS